MTEPVEVAIQKALTDRATAFAAAQSPVLAVSYPNVAFTPPDAKTGAAPAALAYGRWLRLSSLPAPSFRLGVDIDSSQFYGIFQIDVFYGYGAGEYAPKRLASAIAGHFKAKRGRTIAHDGYPVEIYDEPKIAAGLKTDSWWQVPISVPYRLFQP